MAGAWAAGPGELDPAGGLGLGSWACGAERLGLGGWTWLAEPGRLGLAGWAWAWAAEPGLLGPGRLGLAGWA